MLLCVNCGNNIKSSTINYKLTGCPRWRYYIKCNCCNKRNDYTNFINHKLLFTPTILQISSLYRDIYFLLN
jgi:hypothetical protein